MNKILQEKVLQFLEDCQNKKGVLVEFQESISTNQDNFNRHFTTFNSFSFLLQKISSRISGARIRFEGEKYLYELGVDLIISFSEITENIFEFLEKYDENCYRKTVLKFVIIS